MRCAKCAHSWFQEPAADSTDAALAEFDKMLGDINTKPIPKGSNLPVAKRKPVPAGVKGAVGALSLASVALLLLLLKPSLFGFPPSTSFLMTDVDMHKRVGEKFNSYEINGKIVNAMEKAVTVPVLRVTLVDDHGTELQFWEFSEKGKMLDPRGSLPFATGPLEVKMTQGTKFIIDLGNTMELALRSNKQ